MARETRQEEVVKTVNFLLLVVKVKTLMTSFLLAEQV
jgi:hypothetical protein